MLNWRKNWTSCRWLTGTAAVVLWCSHRSWTASSLTCIRPHTNTHVNQQLSIISPVLDHTWTHTHVNHQVSIISALSHVSAVLDYTRTITHVNHQVSIISPVLDHTRTHTRQSLSVNHFSIKSRLTCIRPHTNTHVDHTHRWRIQIHYRDTHQCVVHDKLIKLMMYICESVT